MRPDIECEICGSMAKWSKETLKNKVRFYYLCENGHETKKTEFF